jgi:signal transduction histidine kinase
LILDAEECIFQEKEKSKTHNELLRFIVDTKVKLNIVFPEHVNYSLISEQITTAISSKKLKDNINTKLLYCYNETTKVIIKRISPFVYLKRLGFSVNNSYIFIRDDHDFLVIDPNKLSLPNIRNIGYQFDNTENVDNQKNKKDVNSFYIIYSKNNSLLSLILSFFNSLWFQKETFDNMMEEKSHSDLLVDLITHDIGNHHSIAQAAAEMLIDSIKQELGNADYRTESSSKKDNSYNNGKNVEKKDNGYKDFRENYFSDYSNPKSDSHSHSPNEKCRISINKGLLEEVLSRALTIQNTLDRSQDLVRNILKLERMYRQKEVDLFLVNVIESLEKAEQILSNSEIDNSNSIIHSNNYKNNKRLELKITIPSQYKKEDINILADDLLKEVFMNIFSNAIKYSGSARNEDNSQVKIDVSITEYTLSPARYWMISVADYGQGIPDSIKENLFERFYSKASGTGLGLSIVRALVERYNGRVWVSDRVASSYREGASIGMMFPIP